VDSEGQPVWRASLQDTHTGGRRGFADLAPLGDFLAEQISGPLGSQYPPLGPEKTTRQGTWRHRPIWS
jgi:hypothetical protein